MRLENKTILIISPQAWGQMFISKHHYAITLAKMGNRVYFLNPPGQNNTQKPGRIEINTSYSHQNLLLIEHTLQFPFVLKYHAIRLFHQLAGFHIKKVLKAIEHPIDIVWSFDQGNLFPFRLFGKEPFRIFQPVDEPNNKQAIKAAEGSNLILSVTNEILAKYNGYQQPRHLINHGIGEDFLLPGTAPAKKKNMHVGFSGNLLRQDIDRETMLKIIAQNPDIVFEGWGSIAAASDNAEGNDNDASKTFIRALRRSGVILHGAVAPEQLARELQRMDAFLICYDVIKDQSKGTNYHKIMEYLSTGKVIIANNVSAYHDKPVMVQMIKSRNNNHALPRLFKKVIQNLYFYNSPVFQQQRREYARENTYVNHIGKIQKIIGQVTPVIL